MGNLLLFTYRSLHNEKQIEIVKKIFEELEQRMHYYMIIDEQTKSVVVHKNAFTSITITFDNFSEEGNSIIFMANFQKIYESITLNYENNNFLNINSLLEKIEGVWDRVI